MTYYPLRFTEADLTIDQCVRLNAGAFLCFGLFKTNFFILYITADLCLNFVSLIICLPGSTREP